MESVIKRLSAPDGILEEATLDSDLREFVASGGQPEELVRMLSENYVGYAQMCNLLGEWMGVLDGDVNILNVPTDDNQQQSSTSSTNNKKRKTSGDNNDASNDKTQSVTYLNEANRVVEEHLKTLISQHFDPKQADTIWGQKSAPVWLEYMIARHEWRSLLYKLSAEHKDCLMLNFAIQRISDAGHQSEIASLATASTYFAVFNRVLTATLTALAGADETRFEQEISGLATMAGRTEHTFAYALAVARRLAAHDTSSSDTRATSLLASYGATAPLATDECVHDTALSAAAARLARELELRAEQHSPATHLAMRIGNTVARDHPAVFNSLSLMLASNATNPSDIIRLFNEYTRPDSTAPLALLRHAVFVELLAGDLFHRDRARRLHTQHRHKYVELLALAAAGRGTALAATRTAINEAQRVCLRGLLAAHERPAALKTLRDTIQLPVGAICTLLWLDATLAERSYFTVSYDVDALSGHMSLLEEIARRHPLVRSRVLRVLDRMAALSPGADLDALVGLEVKRRAVDALVSLLLLGYVVPALQAMRRWLAGEAFDQSLIRRFVDRTLEAVAPSYSSEFLVAFCQLCSDERALLAVRASPASLSALQQFVDQCVADEWHAMNATPRDALPALTALQAALKRNASRKRVWQE